MNRIASFESLLRIAQNIKDFQSYEKFVQTVLLHNQHYTGLLGIYQLDVHQTQTLLTLAGTRLAHVESEKTREDFECRIRELERKLS
jgi:hypothetical protein